MRPPDASLPTSDSPQRSFPKLVFNSIRRSSGNRLKSGKYVRNAKGSPSKAQSSAAGPSLLYNLPNEHLDEVSLENGWIDEEVIHVPEPTITQSKKAEKTKKKQVSSNSVMFCLIRRLTVYLQGASVEMVQFTEKMDHLLDLMLMREAEPGVNKLCACGKNIADTRCLECSSLPLQCTQCICLSHRHQPFHWVERWEGTYFVRTDLERLGFELCLGHDGQRCRNIATNRESTAMTIVHHNGIHKVRVAWCDCPTAEDHVSQLMLNGLFPATLTNPQTAFSFAMLNQAHLHILQSKKSAYDYIWAIRRLTNNVFTSDVPVSNT